MTLLCTTASSLESCTTDYIQMTTFPRFRRRSSKEMRVATSTAAQKRRLYHLLVKIKRKTRRENQIEETLLIAVELQDLPYTLIDNHVTMQINETYATSLHYRAIFLHEYLTDSGCWRTHLTISYLGPYVYNKEARKFSGLGGWRDPKDNYEVNSFQNIPTVTTSNFLEDARGTEKLQQCGILKPNLLPWHKTKIRFRRHEHDSKEKKQIMSSFQDEIDIQKEDSSVTWGNVHDFLGAFQEVTYVTVRNNSFLAYMTIFIFLLLFSSGHASTTSHSTLDTQSCGRFSFLQSRSCPTPENMENMIELCEFRQLCKDDEEPKCVPIGKGSVYICVEKNLTCPPGIKWSVFLPENDHTKLTVREEECPDGYFQTESSDCIHACKDKHADLKNIPKTFRNVSVGNTTSSTIITCDETKGYYNNDGICKFDYDLNVSKRPNFYKNYCLHVSDKDFPNPCQEDQNMFPDSLCVPNCIEGKPIYEKANCTCQARNGVIKEKNQTPSATLRTPQESETKTSVKDQTTTEIHLRNKSEEEGKSWKTIAISVGVFLLLLMIMVPLCIYGCRHILEKNDKKEAETDSELAHRPENGGIEEDRELLEDSNVGQESDEGSRLQPIDFAEMMIFKNKEFTAGHRFEFGSNSQIQIHFNCNGSASANSQNGDSLVDAGEVDDRVSSNQMEISTVSDISSQGPEETARKLVGSKGNMNEIANEICSVSEETELKTLYRSSGFGSKERQGMQLEKRNVSTEEASNPSTFTSVNKGSDRWERQQPDGYSFPSDDVEIHQTQRKEILDASWDQSRAAKKEGNSKQENNSTIESLLHNEVQSSCVVTGDSARQK